MKYLKRYNESDKWTENELRRDIDDVLLDIKDDGFDCIVERRISSANKVDDSGKLKKGYNIDITIIISKKFKFKEPSIFDYELIKPTVDRLTEYMNSQGYTYIDSLSTPNDNTVGLQGIFRSRKVYRTTIWDDSEYANLTSSFLFNRHE